MIKSLRPSSPSISTSIAIAVVAVGLSGASSVHGQTVPTIKFSVDSDSPLGTLGGAASIWNPTVRVGPTPEASTFISASELDLDPLDDIDALTISRGELVTGTFHFAFSVDRASRGLSDRMLDIAPHGFNFPFGVADQVFLNQAAGDVFMSSEMFDLIGRVDGLNLFSNALIYNQALMSGQNLNLYPAAYPREAVDPKFELENVNAITDLPCRCSGNADPPAAVMYYISLSKGSPSSPLLGPPSGACVYATTGDPLVPLQLFSVPEQVGLSVDDDIDGLVVYDFVDDKGNLGTWSAGDVMLFSLAPGSPSLPALGLSPATIFQRDGAQTGAIDVADAIASPADLGLAQFDNVDALDIIPALCDRGNTSCISRVMATYVVIDSLNLEVEPLTAGEFGRFIIHNGRPETPTFLFATLEPWPLPTLKPSLGLQLSIQSPKLRARGETGADGTLTWRFRVADSVAGRFVWFQAAQPGRPSQLVPIAVASP